MHIKLRSGLRILAWIIAILFLIWLLVWMYVIVNKKDILARVTTELNSRIKGTITIGDLDPSLISTFPHVSLRLSQVLVRDTMWEKHRHDLLNAEKVFIRLGLISLFSGSPEIKKVIVEKASIYLFSDSSGYSNQYIFNSNNGAGKKNNNAAPIPDVELKNVHLVLEQIDRSKLYDFDVRRLVCDMKTKGNLLQLNVKTSVLVHSLAFNTSNGSFAKEQIIEGSFRVQFYREKKKLEFKDITLEIGDHPFTFTGMFDLHDAPPLYHLSIKTRNVNFRRAGAMLSNNISSKLDSFDIKKPFDVEVVIDGTTRPNRIPLVNIFAKVRNNTLSTPIGEVSGASFTAHFSNQVQPSLKKVDNNSGFDFRNFTGTWENIPLRSDSIKITNLQQPVMECDIHAGFKLERLNELLGSSTMEITRGNCKADATFRGPLLENDTAVASIKGKVTFSEAAIKYVPRNLSLTNCSGQLVFDDTDFFVKELKARSGKSQLVMNGAVKNLTSLIDKSPEKLVLNWNINSPYLDLEDFLSFLGQRTAAVSPNASKRKFLKLANRIDKLLNEGSVDLQLNARQLMYKKFNADDVTGHLTLTDRLVSLKNVMVKHAGGTLSLDGSMLQEAVHNRIKVNATLDNVDVTKVFTAFSNFGQDGLTDKNIRGRLSSIINITGAITDKANIVENSLVGVINLSLKNGALINFEPVQKISQTAFKNRDFSDIRFAELKERLDFNGSEIKVNRMEIQSTVMTMFVEGIYDVKKGTDLSIQIPLSNLAKRGDDFELKNKGVKSRTGVSLRLRAKTGEDGKAKISWDPFNKALKN